MTAGGRGIDDRDERLVGRAGGEPGPTGTAIDDETDRTDLDQDEPGEGFGVGPWGVRDVTRDEALRALSGDEDVRPSGDDPTAPAAEGEGGTEEVR